MSLINDHFILEAVKELEIEEHFYNPDLITQRIKEETLRSNTLGLKSVSLLLKYHSFMIADTPPQESIKIWKELIRILPIHLRASDVRGFAPNNQGIHLLLLDCDSEFAPIVLRRIYKDMSKLGLDTWLQDLEDIIENNTQYLYTPSEQ